MCTLKWKTVYIAAVVRFEYIQKIIFMVLSNVVYVYTRCNGQYLLKLHK
jgi:hypothetical protein